MFNPNELKRVANANTRISSEKKVSYDLAYSPKTKKFRVSPEMFDVMGLDENGLTLYEQRSINKLLLAVEPNEKAVMHRGRQGYDKGREFTSSRLRLLLDQYGFEKANEFNLTKVGEADGIPYYEISTDAPRQMSTESAKAPVDVVPTKEEQTQDDLPQFPAPEAEEEPQTEPDLPDMSDNIKRPPPAPKEQSPMETEEQVPDPFADEPEKEDDSTSTGEVSDDDLDKLLG